MKMTKNRRPEAGPFPIAQNLEMPVVKTGTGKLWLSTFDPKSPLVAADPFENCKVHLLDPLKK